MDPNFYKNMTNEELLMEYASVNNSRLFFSVSDKIWASDLLEEIFKRGVEKEGGPFEYCRKCTEGFALKEDEICFECYQDSNYS